MSNRQRKHRSAGDQDELTSSPKQYALFLANQHDMVSAYITEHGINITADGRPQISKYHEGGSWDKSAESANRRSESGKNISRIWCEECQRDWNPGSWPRHIRKYHEGGEW
jgi:hypothetical protein